MGQSILCLVPPPLKCMAPCHQGQPLYCSLEVKEALPLKGCRSVQCACMAPASCCGFVSPCCLSRIACRCCQRSCTCSGGSTPLLPVGALIRCVSMSGSMANSFELKVRPSYSSAVSRWALSLSMSSCAVRAMWRLWEICYKLPAFEFRQLATFPAVALYGSEAAAAADVAAAALTPREPRELLLLKHQVC
ncbi:hypothetical protein ABBQ32_14191 [Trebouxia sp. C0010 RCD-2024]